MMGYKKSKIETCVCCGEEIPEGRQVCPTCEQRNKDNGLSVQEQAVQDCLDWLIAEGGVDTCSKCVYVKEVGEDCICQRNEKQGNAVCRQGIIKFFVEAIDEASGKKRA